jgi:hypothetical protein
MRYEDSPYPMSLTSTHRAGEHAGVRSPDMSHLTSMVTLLYV